METGLQSSSNRNSKHSRLTLLRHARCLIALYCMSRELQAWASEYLGDQDDDFKDFDWQAAMAQVTNTATQNNKPLTAVLAQAQQAVQTPDPEYQFQPSASVHRVTIHTLSGVLCRQPILGARRSVHRRHSSMRLLPSARTVRLTMTVL